MYVGHLRRKPEADGEPRLVHTVRGVATCCARPHPDVVVPLPSRSAPASLPETSSLSLRWRVMLLAMSMVAMVVVLMALAVYVVVSRALYDDIDNQLHSRARLLIESGSLAADPGKAIEGTAYSDVNAMLVNPGRSIYTANQQGQRLPHRRPGRTWCPASCCCRCAPPTANVCLPCTSTTEARY